MNYSKKEEEITLQSNNKPLKRFGQNYLIDQNILKKIVSEFHPQPADTIIEIGPGRGALTEKLNSSGARVFGIEIDKRVISDLRKKFENVEFISEDFLKLDLRNFGNDKKLRIIGNIPYNITSPILFKLIDNIELINDALFMVQYEVAKRMASKPRTKDYGILSIIVNYFFDYELCFKVPPTVFRPRPKVDSAFVKLEAKPIGENFNKKLFIKIVKAAFGNRRKNLKNSLSNSIFREYDLISFPINLTKRAEELDIEEYLKIYEYFNSKIDD